MKDPLRETSLRIGVALGAGSAAAMAEIGALEAISEAGLPIHCVAGTSAGAIVGAAFASGCISELRECLEHLSRGSVMRLFDLAWPREGFLHGRRALELIRPYLGDQIEAFEIPYAAIATDLRSGEEVRIREGSVFDAVRASIAIPGVFRPWHVGGRLLVDGGLVDPVPVSAVRALGAEFVVAINVLPLKEEHTSPSAIRSGLQASQARRDALSGSGSRLGDQSMGLVEILSRASHIIETQIADHRLRLDPPDCLLQLSVPDTGMFAVHRTGELSDVGRRCAEQALPELRMALRRETPLRRLFRRWSR